MSSSENLSSISMDFQPFVLTNGLIPESLFALGKGSLKKKKKIREFSLRGRGGLQILALFP